MQHVTFGVLRPLRELPRARKETKRDLEKVPTRPKDGPQRMQHVTLGVLCPLRELPRARKESKRDLETVPRDLKTVPNGCNT